MQNGFFLFKFKGKRFRNSVLTLKNSVDKMNILNLDFTRCNNNFGGIK